MKHYLPFLLLSFFACQNEEEPNMIVSNPNWNTDESVNMNSQFSMEEDEEIDLFLETHPDWIMTGTGTGLRYMIYDRSDSFDSCRVEDTVFVKFEIMLLSGDICYSSQENEDESFVVEKSDIESGLHEGVQLLCTGDKAKFILPSRMAHGLIGDEEKIPPLSPVIYDIEILSN